MEQKTFLERLGIVIINVLIRFCIISGLLWWGSKILHYTFSFSLCLWAWAVYVCLAGMFIDTLLGMESRQKD
ncbi:hypothetical protein [Thermoanaerobacter sp. A7A]|uniref:hypothetical protein n=1 Tax=Thermoanaerobacter sp. A7A TaxID=1350366 RepID=UPI00041AD5C7|nr:hypothetical protein [Thermoanaerobacter sp. A7A]